MNKNQHGIAHIGVIAVLVLVIGVIGFAGWKIYAKNRPAASTTAPQSATVNQPASGQTSTTVKAGAIKTPEGYVVYENKDLGFKFAYPKEWGTVVRTGDDTPALRTDGLNGHALRTTFQNGDTKVLPRGYELSGDVSVSSDEGIYMGGYVQKGEKYYTVPKYAKAETQIPTANIIGATPSGLGTVLLIKAKTPAGDRLQLLLNLPKGSPLSGLDLVLKNSSEDFADESNIDSAGLETLKTVAQTFDTL